MASERTEEATPKKRGESQEKGQYGKSQDLNAAVMMSVGMLLLFSFTPLIMQELKSLTVHIFTSLHPDTIHVHNIEGLLAPYFSVLARIILPFLLILMTTGIILMRVQVGAVFSLDNIKPKFDKLSLMGFVKNLGNTFNIFKPQKFVELIKSILKGAIVGACSYFIIMMRKQELFTLLGADISLAFNTIASIMAQIVTDTCIIMLIIGIIDKKYQEYEFNKSIKMTKQDVKDERKNAQGDPLIKGKIKSAQFKMAQQRMIAEIPSATVVVTNPTHYAIAIRYDTNKAPAPQVIAKGVDYIAFKIKEIAENNGVTIIENKPLARTLYKIVPLEGLIPPELYVAVAEVLAYVYKVNKGK